MDIPKNLHHKPIISVDYSKRDGNAGDACFLSIGYAQWNCNDISAKVFRYDNTNEKWARGSEELPLWRVLDLATLIIETINNQKSNLDSEIVGTEEDLAYLKQYIQTNIELYIPRINELKRLLSNNFSDKKEKSIANAPNIFHFATSELSQDAVLSWLIKWADPRNKSIDLKMWRLGVDFIRCLIDDSKLEILSIKVKRQQKYIDICVEINSDTLLVIEDKTFTSEHDDQLSRYRLSSQNDYKGRTNKKYVYLKTGNESEVSYSTIRKQSGFNIITRKDVLSVLNLYDGTNIIVLYYRDYLQSLENQTNSYIDSPIEMWGWYAWQGFYMYLEKYLQGMNWGYVSNPSGGFLGAWWHFKENYEIKMYLQFEQKRVCFKIQCKNGDKKKLRDKYFSRLCFYFQGKFHEIKRPDKFAVGRCMTIGVVDIQIFVGIDGKLQCDNLLHRLVDYERIVDECIAHNNS